MTLNQKQERQTKLQASFSRFCLFHATIQSESRAQPIFTEAHIRCGASHFYCGTACVPGYLPLSTQSLKVVPTEFMVLYRPGNFITLSSLLPESSPLCEQGQFCFQKQVSVITHTALTCSLPVQSSFSLYAERVFRSFKKVPGWPHRSSWPSL